MSVFLTPDRRPFYAGTYFPRVARYGQPGFLDVLHNLSRAWTTNREAVEKQADEVVKRVRQLSLSAEHLPAPGPAVERPRLDLLDLALEQLGSLFDPVHGGFGGPPKFPHADDIRLVLAQHVQTGDARALHMAEHTLDAMMRGGIHDQLAGGFARYSVDERWWIPHFEKMLYDNALLVPAYLEAWRLTGRDDFARVARGCCAWVLAEMVDPEGGLWSTQDADSEGEEGRFYVWQRDEVLEIVGKQHAKLVDVAWNLGDDENFEGKAWALVRPRPDAELAQELGLDGPEALHAALEPLRQKLLEAREQRVHPGTDDKVLVSWNGLMISALARAGAMLDEPRFTEAAARAARFCLDVMRPEGRRLLSTWRAGKAHLNANLADHAYLAAGLLDLFEADGDPRWPSEALALTEVVRRHFADSERAGFFFTSDDHEELVARPRDLYDGALPSSNGVMVEVLLRLHELTGDVALRDEADRTLAMVAPLVRGAPSAFARMLLALLRAADGGRTVVVAGEGSSRAALLEVARRAVPPWTAVVPLPAAGVDEPTAARFPLLAGKGAVDGRATAWPCRGGACEAPLHEAERLAQRLGA
jgi:uncharacterized protein YyaL (SSP411 family)